MIRRIQEPSASSNVAERAARAARADRGLGRTRLTLLSVMLVLGLSAAVVAWRQETRDAESREGAVATGITAQARSTAENAVTGLGGAIGLVQSDGSVSPEAFDAFRREVGEVSSLTRMAYIPVVEQAERSSFESSSGVPISDLDDGFGRAPERDVYWPVDLISPFEGLTAPLRGVDIRHFGLTAEAARTARDTGDAMITETVPLPADLLASAPDVAAPIPPLEGPDGQLSIFFIIKPLYRPGAVLDDVASRREAHAGFIVSVYDGSSLAVDVGPQLPDGVRFAIRDGDAVLASSDPGPTEGVERSFEIGGREWTVVVHDTRAVAHPLTLLILGLTVLIVGGLGYLIRRSDRYERDSARATVLIGRTGDLAQHLAGAATVDDVAAVIARHIPPIFGARAASLGFVDPSRGVLRVHHGPAVSSEVRRRNPERSLEVPGPLSDAVRTGDLVLTTDHADWWNYAAGAGVHEDVAAETRAAAGLPLEHADGTVGAAVAILWSDRQQFDETAVATLRTVAELCEQSLHRADITDRQALRAARLAELAERLAGTNTIEDAAKIITSLGREPVEADAASIGITDRETGVLRMHHGASVDETTSSEYESLAIDADLAVAEAARTGEAVLISDFDSYVERYPTTDPSNPAFGRGARAALPLRDKEDVLGAIVFVWEEKRRFDDQFTATLATIAEMTAQSVQRARLAEHQAEDARHSRDLALLAQGLATRAHSEDVTGFLASSVVTPLDAVDASVGLVHDGVLYLRFSSQSRTGHLVEGSLEGPTPLTVSTPLTDAVRTGEPVLLGTIDELESAYPTMVPFFAELGFTATANVPLRDRTGEVIGAMGVAWDHPVVFTKALRDRLTTIVGISEQTLERSRLADALRDSATRNELLADLAQHVAQSRTVGDLREAVVVHGGAPVEAELADLALVDEPTQLLRIHPDSGSPQGGSEQVIELPLSAAHPAAEAVRTQQPVMLPSMSAAIERYPADVGAALQRDGFEAAVFMPLGAPGGDRLGSICLGWRTRQQFSPATMATIRTIAELCAQTIERTRLGEAEHRLVGSLQHRVVTPLPAATSLSIAQRYRPAAHHIGMGGDWYEGIPLDDGRYALVIGDIAGHGITAVADMIQLRAVIESLVRSGVEPGEIFPRASALLQGHQVGVTASAVMAIIDPAASTLSYITAGHPPPLLRTPQGEVVVLDGGRQPLLGVPMGNGSPVTVPFQPGATLIGYTDGLIERRDEVIDSSISRLQTAAGVARSDDVEAFADELVERCLDGREPDDDVALVIIRNQPD